MWLSMMYIVISDIYSMNKPITKYYKLCCTVYAINEMLDVLEERTITVALKNGSEPSVETRIA